MENIRTLVCKNFNRLVDASPLSKREIAHQMNISEATLQRWKSGSSFPELPNLEKLARVLGVSEREFYTSEEPIIKPIPMEAMLDRLKNVPGKIYELASELSDSSDEVWDDIEKELLARITEKAIRKA